MNIFVTFLLWVYFPISFTFTWSFLYHTYYEVWAVRFSPVECSGVMSVQMCSHSDGLSRHTAMFVCLNFSKNLIPLRLGFFQTSTNNLPCRPYNTSISASYTSNDIMTPLIFVEDQMLKEVYAAYTTSCAWLGYSDEQLTQVCVCFDHWLMRNTAELKNASVHM